jgi:enamine deaminase RidA (YjgF/YER057c/UK114 family)
VLLSDINDFVAMNNIYKTFFTQREPARAAYQVRLSSHFLFSFAAKVSFWD